MRLESKTKLEFKKGETKPISESSDTYVFDSDKERDMFLDLREYLLKSYKGKSKLRRLVANIDWFMKDGRGDFFAGFVFDAQGILSVWIHEGGRNEEKESEYENFMKNHCHTLMGSKFPGTNFVSFALVDVYSQLVKQMEKAGLITIS